MMQYVLVFPHCPVFNGPDVHDVMLIRKAKPEWQKGRLNLVGGKVEPGESFDQAAVREFIEETGLDCYNFQRAGTIRSDRSGFVLGVYTCDTVWAEIKSEPLEKVDWFVWEEVRTDRALMDNLRVVIPLLLAGMTGWELIHGRDDAGHEICKIEWEPAHVAV